MVSEEVQKLALLWRMYELFLFARKYINTCCTSEALAFLF